MPVIDQTEAYNVGPTINSNAELAVPKFRNEAFELPILPSQVDLRVAKPRPMTHRVDHSMSVGTTHVLTRQGNMNPAGAGKGSASSTWGLSGPDAAVGESATARPMSLLVVLGLGLGIGYVLTKVR